MKVDIWSDVVCPWCFVGLANLDSAMARFTHADDVEVVLHSFQLEPNAPHRDDTPLVELLARKYGTTVEQMRANQQRLVDLGAERGIDFRFDDAIRANTFDAHRLIHLAASHGLGRAMKDRLGAAHFTEGKAIGDPEVLRAEAAAVGLPADEVDDLLTGDARADEVAADVEAARRLGVTGVPFFVIDGRYGVSGAQPAEVLLGALDRAWSEREPQLVTVAGADDDSACGPGGCAVPGAGAAERS
ncbi:MAG: DsbA family oxidoreductase [Acidimicrobiales bacterium]|nr:DsbA family oxidoreductase [Acidimicrobiales bacterium]